MILFKRLSFSFIFCTLSFFIYLYSFKPIYFSDTIIFPYAIHPFNICSEQPIIWNSIKVSSILFYLFSTFLLFFFISKKLYIKDKVTIIQNNFDNYILNSELSLKIGFNNSNNLVTIPEKSLYQNILITGTIGTGKTSSAMYPFTKQLLSYKSNDTNEKLGMLILDVKGNYFYQVKNFSKEYNRLDDLIILDLSGNIKYNPLHKPNLKASVLANRLKTILLLFSPNNSESFWLDKVEQILTECIKLCRLYNNGYVTFEELHNLIVLPNYYEEKITILKDLFLKNTFSNEENYNLLSSLNFFEKEYSILDERTKSILKSELTRITNIFISDYQVKKVFCPKQNEINFSSFDEVISDR